MASVKEACSPTPDTDIGMDPDYTLLVEHRMSLAYDSHDLVPSALFLNESFIISQLNHCIKSAYERLGPISSAENPNGESSGRLCLYGMQGRSITDCCTSTVHGIVQATLLQEPLDIGNLFADRR